MKWIIVVIVLTIWLTALILFITTAVGTAYADDNFYNQIPECQTIYGNPDGSWCAWTNPLNGKRYPVKSDDYWYQEHPLGGGAHF